MLATRLKQMGTRKNILLINMGVGVVMSWGFSPSQARFKNGSSGNVSSSEGRGRQPTLNVAAFTWVTVTPMTVTLTQRRRYASIHPGFSFSDDSQPLCTSQQRGVTAKECHQLQLRSRCEVLNMNMETLEQLKSYIKLEEDRVLLSKSQQLFSSASNCSFVNRSVLILNATCAITLTQEYFVCCVASSCLL